MDESRTQATTEQYVGPSATRIADLLPHRVSFERGWFWTSTSVCHGGKSDGLAFRQRPTHTVRRCKDAPAREGLRNDPPLCCSWGVQGLAFCGEVPGWVIS